MTQVCPGTPVCDTDYLLLSTKWPWLSTDTQLDLQYVMDRVNDVEDYLGFTNTTWQDTPCTINPAVVCGSGILGDHTGHSLIDRINELRDFCGFPIFNWPSTCVLSAELLLAMKEAIGRIVSVPVNEKKVISTWAGPGKIVRNGTDITEITDAEFEATMVRTDLVVDTYTRLTDIDNAAFRIQALCSSKATSDKEFTRNQFVTMGCNGITEYNSSGAVKECETTVKYFGHDPFYTFLDCFEALYLVDMMFYSKAYKNYFGIEAQYATDSNLFFFLDPDIDGKFGVDYKGGTGSGWWWAEGCPCNIEHAVHPSSGYYMTYFDYGYDPIQGGVIMEDNTDSKLVSTSATPATVEDLLYATTGTLWWSIIPEPYPFRGGYINGDPDDSMMDIVAVCQPGNATLDTPCSADSKAAFDGITLEEVDNCDTGDHPVHKLYWVAGYFESKVEYPHNGFDLDTAIIPSSIWVAFDDYVKPSGFPETITPSEA